MEGIGGGFVPPSPTLDAKVYFSRAIDELTAILAESGLKVIGCNMNIHSPKVYTSLDELRTDMINHKASVTLDVDCFTEEDFWHKAAASITLSDIRQYFSHLQGDLDPEEEEED